MSLKNKYLKLKNQREILKKEKFNYNFPQKKSDAIKKFNEDINLYIFSFLQTQLPPPYTTTFSEFCFKIFNPKYSENTPFFTIEITYEPTHPNSENPFNRFKFIMSSNKFVNEDDFSNLLKIGFITKIFLKKQHQILRKINKEYKKIIKVFKKYQIFSNTLRNKFNKIEPQMNLLVSEKIYSILINKEIFDIEIEDIEHYNYRISSTPDIMFPKQIRLNSTNDNLYEIEVEARGTFIDEELKKYIYKTSDLKNWISKCVVNRYFPILEYVILNN